VWLVVVCAYTVGLVLLLGGGGGDDDEPRTIGEIRASWSAKERSVAATIERNPAKAPEQGDVVKFRKPAVRKVDCDGDACRIEYGTGVPGNGRIREDQQQMLARLFRDPSLNEVTLRVVRAAPQSLGVRLKPDEETAPGVFLLETRCRRTRESTRLEDPQVGLPSIPATCTTNINSRIGQQQRDAGRQAPPNPSSAPDAGGGEGVLEGGR
jgi:hypothetical protein